MPKKRDYLPQRTSERLLMDWVPVLHQENTPATNAADLPDIIARHGRPAEQAWADFFDGIIANELTRIAYNRAVRNFLDWPSVRGMQLHEITAADVGRYLRDLCGGLSKKKQHHSALRRFFGLLVERHLCIINPALVAKTERLVVHEGKTPEMTGRQSRQLMDAIDDSSRVGRRDRAVIGILMWTGVRAGSIARLRVGDYFESGEQMVLRFDEKRRRCREIPVRHDLQRVLGEHLTRSEVQSLPRSSPLFHTARGSTDTFTATGMQGRDICRMVKRYLARAGLPSNLSPHSCRVAVATDLLEQGVPIEDVQYLLGHADPRTTQLYDRRKKEVTRNIVERIRLGVG